MVDNANDRVYLLGQRGMGKFAAFIAFLAYMAVSCSHPEYVCVDTCSDPEPDYVCVSRCPVLEKKFIHAKGWVIPEAHWKKSGETGRIVSTLYGGITGTQNYVSGVLEGETTYTFPHSTIIQQRQIYSHGVLLEDLTYWWSGKLKVQISYEPPDRKVVKEWYDSGCPKSVETYAGELLVNGEYYDMTNNLDSSVDQGASVRTNRDFYGNLLSTHNFKLGGCDAETTYHPNCMPKAITPYRDGIVDGLRKTYWPGGEPNTIETWVSGKLEGVTIVFRDGEKVEEVPYVNGRKNGVGHIFKDGVTIVQDITWKDDKKHGPVVHYLDDHKCTEWYWKDQKVSKSYYDSMAHPYPIMH
jgi:antitoxin component YwqK of YwqJK toxin-antitoxin module